MRHEISEQVKVARDKSELQLNENVNYNTELTRELVEVKKAQISDKTSM